MAQIEKHNELLHTHLCTHTDTAHTQRYVQVVGAVKRVMCWEKSRENDQVNNHQKANMDSESSRAIKANYCIFSGDNTYSNRYKIHMHSVHVCVCLCIYVSVSNLFLSCIVQLLQTEHTQLTTSKNSSASSASSSSSASSIASSPSSSAFLFCLPLHLALLLLLCLAAQVCAVHCMPILGASLGAVHASVARLSMLMLLKINLQESMISDFCL